MNRFIYFKIISCWEGGFRVPCVIRWPGVIDAGAIDKEVKTLQTAPSPGQ